MIPKNNLSNYIIHNKQHEELISRVEDAIEYSLRFNSFKFLFFVNKVQQDIIVDCCNHYENIGVSFKSNIYNSELQMAVIYYGNSEIDPLKEVVLYQVIYHKKFAQLNHRDILGTIMSLGINRTLLGDIISVENDIYFEVSSTISAYLILNLTKIKNVGITLKVIDYPITRIQAYEKYFENIKSFRLDNVVSTITKQSRQKAKLIIESKDVKLNHHITVNITTEITNNSIISIKGYGRYLIEYDCNHQTKKGNYILHFYKYV